MYNNLLKNIDLYENIPTETFLIFQTDTLINPKYKHLIYEFIDYDYVGAPWSFNSQVGNGGLSLRKKSKMIDIIKKKKYYLEINKHIVELNKNEHEIYVNVNEDSYFSLNDIRFQINFGNEISYDLIIHHDVELNKPTFETAKRFSCESILTEIHFGIHQAYCWTDDLQILYNYFPLALELGKLNSNEKCINFLNNLNTFKN